MKELILVSDSKKFHLIGTVHLKTYYGLKFHAAVNLEGYVVGFELTAVNMDARATLCELLSDAYQPIVLSGKKKTLPCWL